MNDATFLDRCNDCGKILNDEPVMRFLVVGADEVGAFILCAECGHRVSDGVPPLDPIERAVVAFEVLDATSLTLVDMAISALGVSLWDLGALESGELVSMLEGAQKASEMKLLLTPDNSRATHAFTKVIEAMRNSLSALVNVADLIRAGANIPDIRPAVEHARRMNEHYANAVDAVDAQPDLDGEGIDELRELVETGVRLHHEIDEAREEMASASLERWGMESEKMLRELFEDLLDE